MKIFLIVITILVILAGGGYYFYSQNISVENTDQQQGKINIDVVCDGALAYMTFPDGESANNFVKECKEGKHPEVIEQYKAQMGLDDGAEI